MTNTVNSSSQIVMCEKLETLVMPTIFSQLMIELQFVQNVHEVFRLILVSLEHQNTIKLKDLCVFEKKREKAKVN